MLFPAQLLHVEICSRPNGWNPIGSQRLPLSIISDKASDDAPTISAMDTAFIEIRCQQSHKEFFFVG